MQYLTVILFVIFAIIQVGILINAWSSIGLKRTGFYFSSALFSSMVACLLYALAILGGHAIAPTAPPELTSGIFLMFLAALLQGLFLRSLAGEAGRKIKLILFVSAVLFGLHAFLVASKWPYLDRAAVNSSVFALILVWQLVEIRALRRGVQAREMRGLEIIVIIELLVSATRAYVSARHPQALSAIENMPTILVFLNLAQTSMIILSHAAVGALLSSRVGMENASMMLQSSRINPLLRERDQLLAQLSKINTSTLSGAFTASMAHELNQPLHAVQANAALAKKILDRADLVFPVSSEIQPAELLDQIIRDNQRAAGVINTLRNLFIHGPPVLTSVEVDDLVDAALDIMKKHLDSRKIGVVVKRLPAVSVSVVSGEIIQVLVNLISNSSEAFSGIDRSRNLTISSVPKGEYVEISVVDNGKGVDSARRDGLFEIFRSSSDSGMGLGLWLCRYIVGRHSGNIYYEPASGGGSRFVFTLPMANGSSMYHEGLRHEV